MNPEAKTPNNTWLIIAAVVAFLFFNKTPEPIPSPTPPAPIVVPTPWPSPSPTPSVADYAAVTRALAGHGEVAGLARDLYAAMADVIERDSTVITSTAAVRTYHQNCTRLMNQGRGQPVPGMSEAVSAVIAAELGLDAVPLDPAKRAKAVQTFRQLSAACGG